jgi:PKD repeat protein
MNTSFTYTANGIYTITLFVSQTVPTCTQNAVAQTVTISNSTGPCSVNANFNFTQSLNGLVNFNNTSTGTISGVNYSWSFGDNSAISTVVSPVHTYSANGTYVATLTANNNMTPTCVSSKTLPIVVNSYCTVLAGFTYTLFTDSVKFTNTSVPSFSVTYLWNFGNGNTSTVKNPTATYTAGGIYTISLLVSSPSQSCSNTAIQNITVTVNSCNLKAVFTHTVGSSGIVAFTNRSTGANSLTSYTWNFGDGFTSTNVNPGHTYANAGTHYLLLKAVNSATCTDTVYQAINITGIGCTANSNFSLLPTSTPQYSNVIPSYPYNVTSAVWNWGDNSSSNGMYVSHQYSVAGNYNICLTVTASCGNTSSTCASYSITKPAMGIVNVNVVKPATVLEITGLNDIEENNAEIRLMPNPNDGLFTLRIKGTNTAYLNIRIYNMLGQNVFKEVCEAANGIQEKQMELRGEPAGIYFVEFSAGNKTCVSKIVINK